MFMAQFGVKDCVAASRCNAERLGRINERCSVSAVRLHFERDDH